MCFKRPALARLTPYLLALVLLAPRYGLSQDNPEFITIGLLLPDHSFSEMIPAAELAIEEANRAGGYGNREFRLRVRTAEGFWGAGSKESVSLVYDDHVRAIVGFLDGRNGHLAEQVATKSHLSYIEAYATEPTLSQAFVPWFMRVVPNDDQQALVLAKEIRNTGGNRVVVLSNGSYDCRYAVRSLSKALAREAGISATVIVQDTDHADTRAAAEEIIRIRPDHLIIPFDAPYMEAFIGEILGKLNDPENEPEIYGMLHFALGVESRKEDWKSYEGMFLIGPLPGSMPGSMPGSQPGPQPGSRSEPSSMDHDPLTLKDSRAAYLYDAVNLVIEAVRQVGTDREKITDHISSSTYEEGVSGSISFDELGNRRDAARLYRIENGVLQAIQ